MRHVGPTLPPRDRRTRPGLKGEDLNVSSTGESSLKGGTDSGTATDKNGLRVSDDQINSISNRAMFQILTMTGRDRVLPTDARSPSPGAKVEADSRGFGLGLESQQSNVQGLLEDIEGNAWLRMYRGLYLRSSDAVFGPMFVAIYSALLWSGIIPFWVALWLIPLTFVLGVNFILVRAAGIPVQLLPYSRLAAGLVAALEIAVQATFMLIILPLIPDKRFQCVVQVALATVAIFLHYKSFATDPGYLEPGPPPPPMLPDQLAAMQAAAPYHCFTCGIYRPIRSKHCSACGRCVSEMDHHCPVIANCVGCGNRREFAGYLLSLLSAECLWLKLCWDYWSRNTWTETMGIFPLVNAHPGMAYVSLLVIPITLGTGYLTFRQICCIVANLTTNEYIKRHRYEYLKAEDGSFLNPFDNGILNNCIQFWESKRPDWYGMYSEKRQSGLSDAGVHPCSVTALLRKHDSIRLAVHNTWQRRQQQREEWLMQEYGRAARSSNV